MSEADRITSDKNVGNVTKRDIDVLNELINAYEAGLPGCNELMNSEVSAIKNILAELEQKGNKMSEADRITSDKDVENIEDVKEYKINLSQKQSVELLKDTLNKFEIRGEQLYLLKIAIKNILAEREQKDKRIQELEAKLEFKKFGDLDNVEFEEYMSQFIPTQKVIDKIEAIFTVLYEQYENDYQDIQDVIAKIHGKIKKELLGGENENRA